MKIEKLDELFNPDSQGWIPIQPSGQKTQKIKIGALAPKEHNHQISDVSKLQSALDSKVDSETLASTVSGLQTQIDSKAASAHTHSISNITNLQTTLDAKANASDVASTVSVLQQQVNSKADTAHNHTVSQLSDYPFKSLIENAAPAKDDFVVLQPINSTGFQKTRIAKLQPSSLELAQWDLVSTDSEMKVKTFVDSSLQEIVLTLPTTINNGTEFSLKRLTASNTCRIAGITKINNTNVDSADKVILSDENDLDRITRLIYINNSLGWQSYPQASIFVQKALSLPSSGLQQLLYAGNISGINDGALLTAWTETINGSNATQMLLRSRPAFKRNLFAGGSVPAIYFAANDNIYSPHFNINFDLLNNQRFTICIVEQRLGNPYLSNYFLGAATASNTGFYVGYQSSTSFRFGFAGNSNFINYTVPAYTSPISCVWMASCNSRERSLWRNGTKVATTTAALLTQTAGGTLGGVYDNKYNGYLGLVAIYLADQTDTEIKTISDAVNNTFRAY